MLGWPMIDRTGWPEFSGSMSSIGKGVSVPGWWALTRTWSVGSSALRAWLASSMMVSMSTLDRLMSPVRVVRRIFGRVCLLMAVLSSSSWLVFGLISVLWSHQLAGS